MIQKVIDSRPATKTSRLFPTSQKEGPISVPLSIFDATCARFSPTGCIWIFDHYGETPEQQTLCRNLKTSFIATLDEFPQWAGQLQWSSFNPNGNHTERFHRLNLVYGSAQDPGVEWKTVYHPSRSSKDFAPLPSERASMTTWRGDEFVQSELLSNTALALHDMKSYKGLPAMTVQINLFCDDGYAVGVKLAHPLGDAQSLMVFVHRWASKSQCLHGYTDNPARMRSPVFNPQQLDAHALGDIDGSAIDPQLAAIARELPLDRYDCWESDAPGYLPSFRSTLEISMPPKRFLETVKLSPADSAPWLTWDLSRPVGYVQIHFTGEALDKLRSSAMSEHNGSLRLSRLDILLAHVWSAVNRARGLVETSDDVCLNFTLSARTRVSPPLPDSWIGSPIFLTNIKRCASAVCMDSVASLASDIRNTIGLFTPEKLGAMLHDAAHEIAPHRLWQCFPGKRNLLVTSWLRSDVYLVDFEGRGMKPRYVHAVMPKVDGLVQVFDSAVGDGGMDVSLYLGREEVDKLVSDASFRV
jgi:Transferase family